MTYAVVRYSVKDGDAEQNRALIEQVFAELSQSGQDAMQYVVFELESGEFVHIASHDGEESPLPKLTAFKAFIENHAERRSGPISRLSARLVGNYRMLATDRQS
jgi:uncharacterized protein (UPF0297 family)